jgi:hypothetical protein
MRAAMTSSNGSGAQLRATVPPWLDRSVEVQRQTAPWIDWNVLWLVSCSAIGRALLTHGLLRRTATERPVQGSRSEWA